MTRTPRLFDCTEAQILARLLVTSEELQSLAMLPKYDITIKPHGR